MLSTQKVSAAGAQKYFEETLEYYTKSLSNRDIVFGEYASMLGIGGPVTPQLFKKVAEHVTQEMHRSGDSAFRDFTFSCNKSVALARAYSPELADLISNCVMQAATETIRENIEPHIFHRVHGSQSVKTGNAIFFAFNHHTARPTQKNDYVPDLQEHVHVVCANATMCADGRERAIDFHPSLQNIKERGLIFQQKLFQKLTEAGIACEVTDRSKGEWRVIGVTREQELENSHRREDIVKTAQEKNVDMQKANLLSRQKKDKSPENYTEIIQDVHDRYYKSGEIKLQLSKAAAHECIIIKEDIEHERAITRSRNAQRAGKIREQISQLSRRTRFLDAPVFDTAEPRTLESFEEEYRVQELRERRMDDNGKRNRQQSWHPDIGTSKPSMLLSRSAINHVSRLQSEPSRDYYLRQARVQQSRERIKRIDENTRKVLAEAFSTNYAITVPQLRYLVRAANLDEALTDKELGEAINRAHVIDIGRQLVSDPRHPERGPHFSKDRYVTRTQNIEFARDNVDRMLSGKGKIQNAMSLERAKKLLDYVESDEGKRKHHAKPTDDFTIADGEQGAAVLHILTSTDRVIAVVGKAGTGKTTLCERLKWIADETNGEVLLEGTCFTGKAAQGLQQESGIESTTLHSMLNKLEKESLEKWKPEELQRIENSPLVKAMKAVMDSEGGNEGIKNNWNLDALKAPDDGKQHIWIVDEAGLVDDNLMHYALIAAERTNHKLVLVGDPRQLQPVGSGAPLKKMVEAGIATAYLEHARRQRKAAEFVQHSVEAASNGDVTTSFKLLDENGCVKQIANVTKRRERLADKVTADPITAQKDHLTIVATNAERIKLNELIRSRFVERGELEQGKEYTVNVKHGNKTAQEKRNFAPGDRIICLANDKKLGVMNGSMGTIRDFDGDGRAVIDLDDGRQVRFSIGQEYKDIDHSYCVTDYKSQGMSVKHVHIGLSSKELPTYMQKYYVDISRTTDTIDIITDNKKRLLEQIQVEQKALGNEDFEFSQKIATAGVKTTDFYQSPLARLRDQTEKINKMDVLKKHPVKRHASEMKLPSGFLETMSIRKVKKHHFTPGEIPSDVLRAIRERKEPLEH